MDATYETKDAMMKPRLTIALAGAALALLSLAGCSSTPPAATDDPAVSAPADEAPAATDLALADTSLGSVVVDGTGMTVYYFDKDTADSGVSACTGDCATNWPAVLTDSDTPVVDGVTGTVGTIPSGDSKQVTINGRPIYLFAGDKAAGDTAGQGVGGIWWVVAANGDEVMTAP